MITRRTFLKRASVVSLAPVVPGFLAHLARAAEAAADERVLVVIQLDGGNDGINTVVPFADDGYGRARDKLRLPLDELHKLNDHVALHPQMKAAKELFDAGRLAVVQGVGYPNPDRSHFRSMKIWQTASFDNEAHDQPGWLGRALDGRYKDGALLPGVMGPDSVLVGDEQPPVALWGRRSIATSLSHADDLLLRIEPQNLAAPQSAGEADVRAFVERQLSTTYDLARAFAERQDAGTQSESKYPGTELGSRLQLVSQFLKAGSRARVYYVVQDGYDTHAAQLSTHSRLLYDFSRALKSFIDDLHTAGLGDRVMVLAFSEFGRRVNENGSLGTDHGTAGPVFLAGDRVAGGLIGPTPSLSDLDDGDLRMAIDFRQVYATLLGSWLGFGAPEVLGGSFEELKLLA